MTYEPISFPIYGLDDAWPGARWLHDFNGSSEGVRSVRLAHGYRKQPMPDEPWYSVTSGRAPLHGDGWVAIDALHDLIRLVIPQLGERATRRYEQAASRFTIGHLNDRSAWSSATWTVDGTDVEATTFGLAGAWAGYVILGESSVQVFGSQDGDRSVRLVQLADTVAYHFASDDPIEFPDTQLASASAVGYSNDLVWSGWPPHTDHDTVINA